jgi:hypothetical protein
MFGLGDKVQYEPFVSFCFVRKSVLLFSALPNHGFFLVDYVDWKEVLCSRATGPGCEARKCNSSLAHRWIISHRKRLKIYRNSQWQYAIQSSQVMLEDKLCKFENRVLHRRSRKLVDDCIMSPRRLVSRVCFIQSPINIWLRLWGITKARMLQNENHGYLKCQKLQRQMAKIYQVVCDVYHHSISRGVAKWMLIKHRCTR